jgi:hypothetical protein
MPFPRAQIPPKNDDGVETHLARVDLLTAEGVVVGTHLDGWRCADVCRLALKWLSEIVDHGDTT